MGFTQPLIRTGYTMAFSLLAPSLRTRLYGLVLFTIVIILTLVATGIHYYGNISQANTTKSDFNRLISSLQDARVAEKTYLQFFSGEVKGQFEQLVLDTNKALDAVAQKSSDQEIAKQLTSAKGLISQYQQMFAEVVKTHGQQEQLKKDMMQPPPRPGDSRDHSGGLGKPAGRAADGGCRAQRYGKRDAQYHPRL